MTALAFEEVHSYDDSITYYIVPNEEIDTWRNMLIGKSFKRVAGICSAGEVGFFSLLPFVEKELVLVDHSYKSLSIAMMKYFLLRELGPDETHRLLTGNATYDALDPILEKVSKNLPQPVLDAWRKLSVKHPYGTSTAFCDYGYAPGQNVAPVNQALRRTWGETHIEIIRESYKKLDLVSFLHGDLTDLAKYGPFEVLYLSNALEHRDRSGNHPPIQEVTKCLTPEGYVLAARDTGDFYGVSRSIRDLKWFEVTSVRSTHSSCIWHQSLYQIPKEKNEGVSENRESIHA